MLSKALLITIAVLLLAVAASADKTVIIKSLTGANFERIAIDRDAGGVLKACGKYQLKDSTGNNVGTQKVYCKNLTAAQAAAFIAFIRDDVGLIAEANTNEGL